jgi:UDP-2-acetamido-2,6-beta-L-arabino-hexul-4-ose reductase
MNVLVTGAHGFIGRNLMSRLRNIPGAAAIPIDIASTASELRDGLAVADVVYHLAGVNRPRTDEEFETGNVGFTREICGLLRESGRKPRIVMASSVQAALTNPYGVSKLRAENELRSFAAQTGAEVQIYRLKNVFGKWCRPNYNSVVATFCHNIANDIPLSISDPGREIELVYIDDVIEAFIGAVLEIPFVRLTLGDLAGRILAFQEMRTKLMTADFGVAFNRNLYATYLSYVPATRLRRGLATHSDQRGSLTEFVKSERSGQVFISRTKPGITRGNHYHETKSETFLVIEGEALIRMRPTYGTEVLEFPVSGNCLQAVDIPPGHTHSIENIGKSDMITLFWATEIFNPDRPDTFYMPVLLAETVQ